MREIVSFSKEIEFKTMVHTITGISLEHTLELKDDNTIQGDFIVSGTYKMTGASQIEEDFNYKIPVDISIDDKYNTSDLSMDIYDFAYEIINEEILKLSIELSLDNLELKEVAEIAEDSDTFAEFNDLALSDEPLVTESLALEELAVDGDEFMEKDFDEEINIIDDERIDFTPEVEDLFKEIESYKDVSIPVPEKEKPFKEEEMPVSVKEEHPEKEKPARDEIKDNNESLNFTADSIFMAFNDTKETYSTYSVYIVLDGDNVDEIISKYKIPREKLEEYNDLSNIVKGSKLIIPSLNE